MHHDVAGIGHNQPPQAPCPPWLAGAEARIARRERPVTTAGRANENEWVLRFERRAQPEIEPLMGWTGGSDTLATEVELTFASCEEAVAYAERQGLSYRLQGEPLRRRPACPVRIESSSGRDAVAGDAWLALLLAAYGQCDHNVPDLERARLAPASLFDHPDDVVRHPLLSLDSKREILRRWAWDEYLLDLRDAEGMANEPPSRLDEVKAALLRLDYERPPHPAAPAAFVVRYQPPENALAA